MSEMVKKDDILPPPPWSGTVLGLSILTLTVVLGSIYLSINLERTPPAVVSPTRVNNEPETVRASADVTNLEIVSPSDELVAIVADLDATVSDTEVADIQAIDATLAEFEARTALP
jgi:hypothetical protein